MVKLTSLECEVIEFSEEKLIAHIENVIKNIVEKNVQKFQIEIIGELTNDSGKKFTLKSKEGITFQEFEKIHLKNLKNFACILREYDVTHIGWKLII